MVLKYIAIIYEIALVGLALFSVFMMHSTDTTILVLDKLVWLLLFIDVLVRFAVSKNKWKYVKKNPFDLIAIIPLDSIFQTARIVRLFRLLRLFSISSKYTTIIRNILYTNGLNKVLAASCFMLIISSILVTHFEPNIGTYADGLWWSIVTTTTVGYGDISPESIVGRLVAVFLMLVGIGIIGMLTSSITTYFIKNDEKDPALIYLKSELDRYNQLDKEEKDRLVIILKDLNNKAP
ncbi:potassium channel family protein [Oceanobacillus saliphilus]|uniref:potassium channel family protein n=1 Tax=Oceanobacillus saliphilus TaxID=2925834 RepID=UPI00201DCECD|nr:potassium channel family protein [Oceanobacillus saliphilus]